MRAIILNGHGGVDALGYVENFPDQSDLSGLQPNCSENHSLRSPRKG